MISAIDIVTPRFQLAFFAAILFQILHSVAMPPIVSATEQEPPSRHSLIHRSDAESSALPATTHGTILQPSNAESTHITSPIEPHKPSISVSPVPMPAPQHRMLTKRPAIASITAPAPAQTPNAAGPSDIVAGQGTQTTADTGRSTTPTATAPITKSTAAPSPGVTATGSVAAASTAPSPFAGAADNRPVASTGSDSVPASSGSRSATKLLQNPAIASLLQPQTPAVSTPPAPPPPSTPPSTPPPTSPPSSPSTGSVTLTWTANGEPDLAGYKIYIGTASGTYSFPGSPFVTGTVTRYAISNLPKGHTYSFAISAYDSAGNESPLSAEVSKSLY